MNEVTQEKVDNSYLLGCINYHNQLTFYLMPIAYWILNYEKYDPAYNPDDWEDVFRDNILNVDDDDTESFLKSIKVDEINIDSINSSHYNLIDIFLFYIDFDKKTYVSFFDDIDVEEYLPNDMWTGTFDNPISYLPREILSELGIS